MRSAEPPAPANSFSNPIDLCRCVARGFAQKSDAHLVKRLFGPTLLLVFLASLFLLVDRAQARPPNQDDPPGQVTPGVDNETCLACHATPGQTHTLPSGENLFITVDRETYDNSVHGKQGYACVQCHTNITGYPHPPLAATTLRETTLEMYTTCAQCHQDKFDRTLDSVHQKALAGGNENAAVCTDCHGAHNVQPISEMPRSAIPQTCERCHSQISAAYADSVHGSALLGEGNPDVPTCIDCHGVHNVQGPSNGEFHLFSPEICARCHADQELMAKYGINTDVFDTYVADFHGTTVEIFQDLAPGQETNKPVCIDCHGVHDMKRVDDPESAVIKDNLLATCQKCHPDATANFPDAWLSHYRPSPTHYPIVYYVQSFYKFFIPIVLGGMALFIVTDVGRRLRSRRKKNDE
jgi:hypothetical protein